MGAQPQVVFLTGASTGLGLAVARRLLDTSHLLVLTARRSSLPRFEAAGIKAADRVLLLPLDAECESERHAAVAAALERFGRIDVLINNAGIAYRTVLEHATPEAVGEIFTVNFVAALDLMRLVLPGMRERRSGRIVNISSVGGMVAMPTLSLYSASKFALEGATEALWYEVRPFGIHVTLIEPGFVRSDSFRHTRYTAPSRQALRDPVDAYHAHYTSMDSLISRLMGLSPNTTESVARTVLRVLNMRRPPLRVAATVDAHVFALLRRFLPRRFYHRFLYGRLPDIGIWGEPPQRPPPA